MYTPAELKGGGHYQRSITLSQLKLQIKERLRSTLKVVDGNPSPPSRPSKLQLYRGGVRGKSMTILDSKGLPSAEMLRQVKQKFGADLESVI